MNKLLISLLVVASLSTTTFAQKYSAGVRDHIKTYIEADTIHASKTLYDNIKDLERFSIATKIMELTQVQNDINALEMATVFVPSDEAFSGLSEKELTALLTVKNSTMLKDAFLSHIIAGRMDAHSLRRMVTANGNSAIFRSPGKVDPEAVGQGNDLYITVPGGPKARFQFTNLLHKQGIFHVVDSFLMVSVKK
ncbi:MAG: fasciclin domain-containing protein [Gilvibacter sp.]